MPSPLEYAKQFFKDNPRSPEELETRTCTNCDGNCQCKASKGVDNNHSFKETKQK